MRKKIPKPELTLVEKCRVLKEKGYNQVQAAQALGMSRRWLIDTLKKEGTRWSLITSDDCDGEGQENGHHKPHVGPPHGHKKAMTLPKCPSPPKEVSLQSAKSYVIQNYFYALQAAENNDQRIKLVEMGPKLIENLLGKKKPNAKNWLEDLAEPIATSS